ncbi:MAG TPA: alpha/beta fold hydrolase [Ignavibacteriaceae bacterium]|nr:alpha/beta fold hydrolase [Ignavibacteriaceae bacterium]
MKLHLLVILFFTTLIFFSCGQKEERKIKQYAIEDFYKNKQIAGGSFSPDESKLLVTSNESGIYNVYEISIADGKQKQVTSSKVESFFAVDYVPSTGDILYRSDKGGNEISHIYLLSKDGSAKDLTPDSLEKANFIEWSLDKNSFFYLSNKRDPKYFDLYKMEVGTWKSNLVYLNDKGLDLNAISWDEKNLALSQSITTSETKLFLYNISSKEMKEISDPSKKGIYSASDFSKDNKSLFYITDVDKEFRYLVRYDIESGKSETVFETNWDVMYSYNSENEKYKVIGVNADGKNELKIISNETGKEVSFPEIPDGDITAVSISQNEKLMRLTVGTSKATSNIYVYNFDSKELKKLTNTLNPDINPDDLVSAEVVRFKSFDDLEIPAIYYKPLNASPDNKVPALIWVHGGPGGQTRVGYFALIQFLVNHGYAILAVNNRGSSGYGKSFYKMDDLNHGEKDLMDCIYGKKYLETLDYIDSEKIGIIGGSYGGYMTMAAMAFHPDEFKVGVDIFGVTNWLRTLKSIPPYWESFREALYKELGDPFSPDSVRLYNISPLFHADKIKNPVMVLQGANDPRVLKVESDEIVEAMKKNNVPVEYLVFPDEGHGFVKKENEIKGYGAIVIFLDKYLKGNEK